MDDREIIEMNGISDEMLLRSEKNILVINSRKIKATNLMDDIEPNVLLARAASRRKLIYRQSISQNIYTGRRERNQSRSCYRGSTN